MLKFNNKKSCNCYYCERLPLNGSFWQGLQECKRDKSDLFIGAFSLCPFNTKGAKERCSEYSKVFSPIIKPQTDQELINKISMELKMLIKEK